MKKDNSVNVLIEALKLSKGLGQDFYDSELANNLQVSQSDLIKFTKSELYECLCITKLNEIKCPKCESMVSLYQDGNIFCGNCGEDISGYTLPKYELSINVSKAEKFFIDRIVADFKAFNWKPVDVDSNFVILKKGNHKIALSIKLQNTLLKDYFALRGWSIDETPEAYILFSFNFDSILSALSDKEMRCTVSPLTNIQNKNYLKSLLDSVNEKIKVQERNEEIEKTYNLHFKEYLPLEEVQDSIDAILKELSVLALQKGKETHSKQGIKFQKYIISLFNLTLFRAKLCGGNNQPDGVIYLLSKGECPKWLPCEIKSFKGNLDDFYEIKNVSAQLRKYSIAFTKDDIQQRIKTPFFIIIAYDFNKDNQENFEILDELKLTHNIHYVMFPLKSILYMVKLFLENNVPHIPNDKIEKFFANTRYVDIQDIDNLFKELITYGKSVDSSTFRLIRGHVKQQGI